MAAYSILFCSVYTIIIINDTLLQDEYKTLRGRAKQSNIHHYYYLRLSVCC